MKKSNLDNISQLHDTNLSEHKTRCVFCKYIITGNIDE